jgi:nucleotide-binding universal stress UspA family protein
MISQGFTHILIPIEFSSKAETAIRKGIEMAQEGTTITLLHIDQRQQRIAAKHRRDVYSRMKEWKQTILDSAMVNVNICIAESRRIQKTIAEYSNSLKADLIIIGKQNTHIYLPFLNTVSPGELVKQCNCAVLTVRPGTVENKIRTIVVYLGSSTRVSKMETLKSICSKFKVKIHLVVFNDKEFSDPFEPSGFLQMYQWLKSFLHCPVEYTILDNRNKASALLEFGRKVNADILLIHGVKEIKTGFTRHSIHHVLPAASMMQVLSIH